MRNIILQRDKGTYLTNQPVAYSNEINSQNALYVPKQRVIQFEVPTGYSIIKADVINLPFFQPRLASSALAVSYDLRQWVPIEHAIGLRTMSNFLYVNELYFDIKSVNTSSPTGYGDLADPGAEVLSWPELAPIRWNIWLSDLDAQVQFPVTYDMFLNYHVEMAADFNLTSLPIFTDASYNVMMSVESSALGNAYLYLVRLPRLEFSDFEYIDGIFHPAGSSDPGPNLSLMGTAGFRNFGQGNLIQTATQLAGGVSVNLQARMVNNATYYRDAKEIKIPVSL